MRREVIRKTVSPDDCKDVFRQLPERKILISARTPDYLIEDVTNTYAAMIGRGRESIVGKPYFDVFPLENDVNESKETLIKAFRAIKHSKKNQSLGIIRYDIPNPDNSDEILERYWRPTLYPIIDAAGTVVHIVQVSSNATQEILAKRELEEAKHRLEAALEAGRVGSWAWDFDTNLLAGDAGFAEEFGMPVEKVRQGLPLDTYLQFVHKDDRERVWRALRRAVDSHATFDTEFRIVQNTKTRWVIGRGRVLDNHGANRFSGVVVDVTERRDLQAQIDLARRQDKLSRAEAKMLKERNDELQALSRTKDEFVALASHQLRTPATAVKQYLGMVLQGYAGDISDVQTEMLRKAFDSNERQIQIINQILNAARADTGKLAMSMAPIDFAALLRGVTDELRTSIENRAHKLIVRLPDAPCVVRADAGYMRMAIENLISNADKYTPEDGVITITLRESGGWLRLSVKDTGVGIEKSDFDKLFVKFSRVHNPLSIQAGGSGIGLYLAGEIVRLHGGKIEVKSIIDRGTTFTITLPLSK